MNSTNLFEISWEVCNKVGGIHTVLSTKAREAVHRWGDRYIAVGPWLLTESDRDVPFDPEPGHEDFLEACRASGIPVRLGRWRTPGHPRVMLVEFSKLYEHKDDVLARLWETSEVDSLAGSWDYFEPVLFGWAAGQVIERYWEEYLAPAHRRAIVHSHEWMTASALLYLKPRVPSIGTVFTTHATMLGRALSSLGHSPSEGLGGRTAADLAEEHQVSAKHSIEGVAARAADVFTTVSSITADEAELLHERRPDPLLPNGIDLDVIDELAGKDDVATVRGELLALASRFVGEDVADAALLAISGRYEFHNKGMDLLLDALAQMVERDGRRVVLFVLVPAGNSGVRREVLERRKLPIESLDGPVGLSTHNLFDEEHDPVHQHCAKIGLANAPGSRVKVIQVPIYLGPRDGLLNRSYEAVLRAMDLTCFPSYYEPWGYTPQESLAVGVPTVTSDYAGFGRWARGEGLGPEHGLTVLDRVNVRHPAVVEALVEVLERGVADTTEHREAFRATASRTAWSDLIAHYETAYARAADAVAARGDTGVPQARRPRRALAMRAGDPPRRPRLVAFDVAARLPEPLCGLLRLSRNLWWSWDPDATRLFADISERAWLACGRNPVAFLQRAYPEDLEAKASDAEFVARLDAVLARFDAALTSTGDSRETEPESGPSVEHPIAYFSAEFGIHESLPIYSGGLGVLAGDHLKSASDLGLPLVGVGLFYRMGYMSQRLTADGAQTAVDIENDPSQLPAEAVREADGSPLEIEIPLPGRELHLRAWRVPVGRVSLYLLDANTPSNRPEDRDITRNLYGGDAETRIVQEIVLGRGGARLLRRLGLRPSVCHMNEGHAAFLTLERVGRLVREEGLTFDAAREHVRATTAFTTHTPVPAGHDRFDEDLVRRYFSDATDWVGVPWERFWALGTTAGDTVTFNMTYLALNFAGWVNGVSQLHGAASRRLLRPFWPGLLEEEVPVQSITNGIHLATWTHPAIARALGATGRGARAEDFAANAARVDTAVLWQLRQETKRELITATRQHLEKCFVARSDSPLTLARTIEGLGEDALLIGLARRFAPYKRAQLVFSDIERLHRILDDAERPVRILVAGKAHPRDGSGQEILKNIAELARRDDLIGRVVFLENYDMALARLLVQGTDVWLNTPTRMLEASGTSGMKAAANGVLNLSVADGWWPEAADGTNGWTIARERLYAQQELQNQFDAAALYRLLEEEVVPRYFERDVNGVPQEWLAAVARCLATVPVTFNTDRMVRDYTENAYRPLARAYFRHKSDGHAGARAAAAQTHRIRRGFPDVRIVAAHMADPTELRVGDPIEARLEVNLGPLQPADVVAELVLGRPVGDDDLADMVVVTLPSIGPGTDNVHVFEGASQLERSGSYAHGLRVRARNGQDDVGVLRDLVVWA